MNVLLSNDAGEGDKGGKVSKKPYLFVVLFVILYAQDNTILPAKPWHTMKYSQVEPEGGLSGAE